MTDNVTNRLIRVALLKGCLGGIGMAAVFLAISGITYLLLSGTELAFNLTLFLSILSGPVIGTVGLVAFALWRAQQPRSTTSSKAPASQSEPDKLTNITSLVDKSK